MLPEQAEAFALLSFTTIQQLRMPKGCLGAKTSGENGKAGLLYDAASFLILAYSGCTQAANTSECQRHLPAGCTCVDAHNTMTTHISAVEIVLYKVACNMLN